MWVEAAASEPYFVHSKKAAEPGPNFPATTDQ